MPSFKPKTNKEIITKNIKKKCCCGTGLNLCKILTPDCIHRLKFNIICNVETIFRRI